MIKLKLENKDLVLDKLKNFSEKNNLDIVFLMEEFYQVIIQEIPNSIYLDEFLILMKPLLNKNSIFETEEEIYHIISKELTDNYTETFFKNCDKDEINKIFKFLNDNYLDIFKSYYLKKGFISSEDYDECIISVFNNFTLEKETSDIIVGKWIEENIIS